MGFRGYFQATSALLTAFSSPPANPVVDDTLIALWQDPNSLATTSRHFLYSGSPAAWGVVGSIVAIDGVISPMYPIEGRYLGVLDPNGLGMFATNFAYVNTVRIVAGVAEPVLATWALTNTVGQDILEFETDLEIHDIFTGATVNNMPSTVGLLPIYIRSNGVVVGVGTGVYRTVEYNEVVGGHWVVLWFKMAIAAGAAPRVVYDTATIIHEKQFRMIGDTTAYSLVLQDNLAADHPIEGLFDGANYTVYDFTPYKDTWVFFTVKDSSNNVVYQGRRGLTDESYTPPATGPLTNMSISAALSYISEVLEGGHAVTIDHNV